MAEHREKWASKVEFVLASLGCAVGLGNVWRFPYLCGRNGGAAFLIPYLIFMVFVGIPTYYMESALGQYSGVSPSILYSRMSPLFAGLGPTFIITAFLGGVYYIMIMGWAIRYLVASLTSGRLPWASCNNWWNTDHCYDFETFGKCNQSNLFYVRGTCTDSTSVSQLVQFLDWSNPNTTRKSPADEYLNRYIFELSGSFHNMGAPKWDLVVVLAVSWIMVFLCIVRGIKTSGKVVYFTTTFPYLILFVLMVRGALLEGAVEGIKFYLIPDLSKLARGQAWLDAATQVLFSLSVGFGGLTTLSSYNEFNNNFIRDLFIVCLGDWITSLICGFVIFTILGSQSLQTGRPVAELANSGPGLAFATYPDALARLPVSQLWSVLFFLIIVLLSVDTELIFVEVVTTWLTDQWPWLRQGMRKTLTNGAVCLLGFICGIILTTRGGPYFLTLMDNFAGGWPLVIAAFFELIFVSYIYGVRRFISDVKCMLGSRAPNCFYRWFCGYPVSPFWIGCWVFVSPMLLLAVQLYDWSFYTGVTYGDYEFTAGGETFGWLMGIFCVIWIPAWFIFALLRALFRGESVRKLMQPTSEWRPAVDSTVNGTSDIRPHVPSGRVHPMHVEVIHNVSQNPQNAYEKSVDSQQPNIPPFTHSNNTVVIRF